MAPPRPRLRLVPSGADRAMRKARMSFFGSWMRTAASSRPSLSRLAVLAPRAKAAKASTRRDSGAFFSWRTSQFRRVAGRPTFGASTSTMQVTRFERRSSSICSGAALREGPGGLADLAGVLGRPVGDQHVADDRPDPLAQDVAVLGDGGVGLVLDHPLVVAVGQRVDVAADRRLDGEVDVPEPVLDLLEDVVDGLARLGDPLRPAAAGLLEPHAAVRVAGVGHVGGDPPRPLSAGAQPALPVHGAGHQRFTGRRGIPVVASTSAVVSAAAALIASATSSTWASCASSQAMRLSSRYEPSMARGKSGFCRTW